jgi:hypothetical protein
VVKLLDRPCEDDEAAPLPGSGLCVVAGAVLCVVGVVCTSDAPCDVPGAVLCVVGVACTPDAVLLGVVDVEACAGWDALPVDWTPWPEVAPDDGELPRSACGAAGCAGWPAPLCPPNWVPVSACGAPLKLPWPLVTPPCWLLSSPLPGMAPPCGPLVLPACVFCGPFWLTFPPLMYPPGWCPEVWLESWLELEPRLDSSPRGDPDRESLSG